MTAGAVTPARTIGIVVIGRNEGERLRACFESLPDGVAATVYVDSGSTDGSLELARSRGIDVVELDLSVPFTAARARNEGVARVRLLCADVFAVHVMDGDCALEAGWMEKAIEAMGDRVAVVCGARRERYPEATIYNRLCDIDWEGPAGEVGACGGDALLRVEALEEVDGYNPRLIAGEEPEMCFRMREAGWKVIRLDETMTWHDAAMTKFSQLWKRSVRAGYACIEGAVLHGSSRERYNVRGCVSVFVWSVALPVFAIFITAAFFPWGMIVFAAYPLQWGRLTIRESKKRPAKIAASYAGLLLLDKFAQLCGMATYLWRRALRKPEAIIEYKGGVS